MKTRFKAGHSSSPECGILGGPDFWLGIRLEEVQSNQSTLGFLFKFDLAHKIQ